MMVWKMYLKIQIGRQFKYLEVKFRGCTTGWWLRHPLGKIFLYNVGKIGIVSFSFGVEINKHLKPQPTHLQKPYKYSSRQCGKAGRVTRCFCWNTLYISLYILYINN